MSKHSLSGHPPYIIIIGAANMDINAKSQAPLIPRDSNPANITLSCGGVGRNIAENLARLGVPVKLIAPVGDDLFGRKLLEDGGQAGIDMAACKITPTSSVYIAVLDPAGEMHVAAVGDAGQLGIPYLRRQEALIRGASIIMLETNLQQAEIFHLLDTFPDKAIYADAISVTKAARIRDVLGRFHTLKMNRMEASFLSGHTIADEASLEKVACHFINEGTKRVVISLGAEGLYYRTKKDRLLHRPNPIVPVSVTGAGDALMAGILYGSFYNKTAEYTVAFAAAMAKMALMSESAVSAQISAQAAEKEMGNRYESSVKHP